MEAHGLFVVPWLLRGLCSSLDLDSVDPVTFFAGKAKEGIAIDRVRIHPRPIRRIDFVMVICLAPSQCSIMAVDHACGSRTATSLQTSLRNRRGRRERGFCQTSRHRADVYWILKKLRCQTGPLYLRPSPSCHSQAPASSSWLMHRCELRNFFFSTLRVWPRLLRAIGGSLAFMLLYLAWRVSEQFSSHRRRSRKNFTAIESGGLNYSFLTRPWVIIQKYSVHILCLKPSRAVICGSHLKGLFKQCPQICNRLCNLYTADQVPGTRMANAKPNNKHCPCQIPLPSVMRKSVQTNPNAVLKEVDE